MGRGCTELQTISEKYVGLDIEKARSLELGWLSALIAKMAEYDVVFSIVQWRV